MAPINPGAALSPDGSFLLAGGTGLAPSPPGGNEAVYQVAGGQVMSGLDGVTEPVPDAYSASPAQPWSPSGTQVLIDNTLYSCDACGPLDRLETEATSRTEWARPLSATNDRPPSTDPYA